MNRSGKWRLSPAFDISYAWDPIRKWTSRHQMSVNGKRDDIDREDLIALAHVAGIKKVPANKMLDRVIESILRWPNFAEKAGVAMTRVKEIQAYQTTKL